MVHLLVLPVAVFLLVLPVVVVLLVVLPVVVVLMVVLPVVEVLLAVLHVVDVLLAVVLHWVLLPVLLFLSIFSHMIQMTVPKKIPSMTKHYFPKKTFLIGTKQRAELSAISTAFYAPVKPQDLAPRNRYTTALTLFPRKGIACS